MNRIFCPAQPTYHTAKLIFAALFLVVSLGACGSKNEPVLNAYRLIDEHRTDEAIELLENALQENPDNAEYKAVLASAYAHKSGVRIQNLVPAINQTDKLKNISDKLPVVSNEKSASENVNTSARNVVVLLSRFAYVFDAYSSIPVIEKTQANYLRHAIFLLNDIGSTIKPEDALYRAVLELVLFKHILAENIIGEFKDSENKNQNSCRIDLGNVNDTIVQLGKLVIDIYNDIGITQPRQAEAMKKSAAQVADLVSNFTIFTTTVTAIDEAANILLKQTALQNGFGKIIKCGGS